MASEVAVSLKRCSDNTRYYSRIPAPIRLRPANGSTPVRRCGTDTGK